MTTSQSIQIYEILGNYFTNKEDAKKVVESIERVIDEKVDAKTGEFEKILSKDIENVRVQLKGDIDISKGDIRKEIAESKTDMIKWMFIFWIGSVVATLGGLIAIVRFMVVK